MFLKTLFIVEIFDIEFHVGENNRTLAVKYRNFLAFRKRCADDMELL